jgi:hypothetical protein
MPSVGLTSMLESPATLFRVGAVRAEVLTAADLPELQAFFEANPEYTLAVNGELPHAHEAQEDFDELPPADMPYRHRWVIGLRDEAGALQAYIGVLSDLLAEGVWHIGIFLVATALHGTGAAQSFNAALESWMISNGARWLRLGVVEGNTRAERFWQTLGYCEVRRRSGVTMGSRSNTVRVLVKPLAGSGLADYLARVPRDHVGAA